MDVLKRKSLTGIIIIVVVLAMLFLLLFQNPEHFRYLLFGILLMMLLGWCLLDMYREGDIEASLRTPGPGGGTSDDTARVLEMEARKKAYLIERFKEAIQSLKETKDSNHQAYLWWNRLKRSDENKDLQAFKALLTEKIRSLKDELEKMSKARYWIDYEIAKKEKDIVDTEEMSQLEKYKKMGHDIIEMINEYIIKFEKMMQGDEGLLSAEYGKAMKELNPTAQEDVYQTALEKLVNMAAEKNITREELGL